MKLSDYIKKVGDKKAAEKFGVQERTAASWRRGERIPKPRKAQEIVELLDGLVSLEGCYQ